MNARTDKILAIIDGGLQRPDIGAHGYGTDMRPEMCARCQVTAPANGGELCGGCRAFLLGDSDVDPTASAPTWSDYAFAVRHPSVWTPALDAIADIDTPDAT